MPGAMTRRQAALAAAADETPIKTSPESQPEEQVVINGNGKANAEDAPEAPPSRENIFLFVPNLIGTHRPFH